MKRLIIALTMLFIFSISAHAQMGGAMMGEQKGEMRQPGMAMEEGMRMPMMPMMQMCQQMMMGMMQMMMGHHMMMRDMMYMMMDMIKMQKKIVRGLSPVEKKEMRKEMDSMIDRLEKMMSDTRMMRGMGPMPPPTEPKQEEPKKEQPPQKGAPKTEPHKH